MNQYLALLSHVLEKGVDRADRTGIGTRSLFGHQMRFDLSEGFPLVTTKKVYFRAIIYELLWFLRGDTNKDRTQPGMMSRDNSSFGTSSQTENPFAVPSSIPLSRQSSASESPPQPSSFEAARRNKSLLALRRSRKASRKSYKRPVMSRASSTHSNLSVGSDMSRMSSMASNILTDQEKFASLALKERRRKLLEADLRA